MIIIIKGNMVTSLIIMMLYQMTLLSNQTLNIMITMNFIIEVNVYIKLMILVCFIPIFELSMQTLKILKHSLAIWSLVLVLQLYLKHGLLKEKSEIKPRKLEGYQNYHGNRGSSIKSGRGFYVKEGKKGIKFKTRKDLDIAYHNTDNEFYILLGLKYLMVTNQT